MKDFGVAKGDLGESGGAPSLRVKKGTGDDFRTTSPNRRGRVRKKINYRTSRNENIKSEALYTGKRDIEKSSEFLVIIQSQLLAIAVSCCKKSS